jgi:hypothetical protein
MITNNKFFNNYIKNLDEDQYKYLDENKYLDEDQYESINNEYNILNREVKFIIECCDKINKILGEEFEQSYEYVKEHYNAKIVYFKFVNKSGIKNSEKTKYINKKIELLKKNNFIEIEDLKISGKGRYIKINIKTINDYEKDKILLLEEFTNKIKLIDEKINILMKK